MGSAQKYSLKWNDFTVNVASTFRDLHSRHDFVDVTLACADGSTLEAHKVILSSVSTYFRDILKTTPCKHPIIILKDTNRDEASAMLEFAYTGEVNVAQDLLPSLLDTARAFRIKGLDKVENPVDPTSLPPPPPLPPPAHQPAGGGGSQTVLPPPPPAREWPQQPPQQDIKPTFLLAAAASAVAGSTPNGEVPLHLKVNERRRPREVTPPPSLPNSQPPTRENSPCPTTTTSCSSARTPPPKRWKKSFDMTSAPKEENEQQQQQQQQQQPPQTTAENYSYSRSSTLPYPHSMPTSPTMFERGSN